MKTLRRVAVLGAGTMGSRIAAHLANAGVEALLLDIVLPGQPDRDAAAKKGIENALKQKPPGFFVDSLANLVTPGNLEDNLGLLGSCDWVIEAVTENLDVKRSLWEKVEKAAGPETVFSTNTSGIPLSKISEGFSPSFRRRFFGTHFFNPPRYLHLVEVIPGAETEPGILSSISEFCDRRLGKGVVPCKDTPNFIGNRIGTFFTSTVTKIMMEDDYTVEEVDALTGSLIGLPNSASWRLIDLIGLDVWVYILKNLYGLIPEDPWRERLVAPPFLLEMYNRGWLGDKKGQGFYRKTGANKELYALDWKTLEYHPAVKPEFPTAEAARRIDSLPERLRMLVNANDRAGSLLWKLFSDIFLYSAERVPEISDRVVEIDRAMRWGYAHKLGPFEYWDAMGFESVCRRIENEGRALPGNVQKMLSSGAKGFYAPADSNGQAQTKYFDFRQKAFAMLEERPGVLALADVKRARGVVRKNSVASLIDAGDGVLCVEFHGKANALDEDSLAMICAGIEETERNFAAMIVANEGEAFSSGFSLMPLLTAAREGKWDEIDAALRRFQQGMMALKYALKPVVAAPFSRTLGGGCEVVLHCKRVQAFAELSMGLNEVAVGLIPAGGGCKELLLRLGDPQRAFDLIASARVSGSGKEARLLGLLNEADGITMNPERLIADAKELALSLVSSHVPSAPASIKLGGLTLQQAGSATGHDIRIAEKLAFVLSGGRLSGQQTVSEQHLLDLEREAFLSLCGTQETQDRIAHMLKTGKPLKN